VWQQANNHQISDNPIVIAFAAAQVLINLVEYAAGDVAHQRIHRQLQKLHPTVKKTHPTAYDNHHQRKG